jgi:hypothetical protein
VITGKISKLDQEDGIDGSFLSALTFICHAVKRNNQCSSFFTVEVRQQRQRHKTMKEKNLECFFPAFSRVTLIFSCGKSLIPGSVVVKQFSCRCINIVPAGNVATAPCGCKQNNIIHKTGNKSCNMYRESNMYG